MLVRRGPMREKVLIFAEVNRVRFEFIIDTFTSVDNRELDEIGGKVIDNYDVKLQKKSNCLFSKKFSERIIEKNTKRKELLWKKT